MAIPNPLKFFRDYLVSRRDQPVEQTHPQTDGEHPQVDYVPGYTDPEQPAYLSGGNSAPQSDEVNGRRLIARDHGFAPPIKDDVPFNLPGAGPVSLDSLALDDAMRNLEGGSGTEDKE
jgi:hypothetical protein